MCLSKLDLAGPKLIKLSDAEIGIYYKLPRAVITFCTVFSFLYVFVFLIIELNCNTNVLVLCLFFLWVQSVFRPTIFRGTGVGWKK